MEQLSNPPKRIRSEVEIFKEEYPDEDNVFVMMPYGEEQGILFELVANVLESYSLVPHLAEHRIRSPQVWTNI